MFKVKPFISQCRRVWRVLKKPDTKEYKVTAKVAAVGLGVIGLIGFILSIIVGYIDRVVIG